MVKPGVYTVDKKNVNLKQGEGEVEYVHVQVKPSEPQKPTSGGGGCTVKRLVGFMLLAAVLTGIAVGVTYALKWQSPTSEMPEGGDVIYPPEGPGDHDGHHGDHSGDSSGDHDSHHGDHSGDSSGGHDSHHGDHSGGHDGHGDHSGGHDGHHDHDGRPVSTERPPPIDYIGTRPPRHPTHPPRPTGTRPPHGASRPPHRPPHHPHHPPHGATRPPYYPEIPSGRPLPEGDYPHPPADLATDSPDRPLLGRPDGHDNHGGDDQPRDDANPEYDREDFDHPKMDHPQAYRGINAWRADHAIKQRKMAEQRMRAMTGMRPIGRSRVETEEEQHGYDYGHSNRNPMKAAA